MTLPYLPGWGDTLRQTLPDLGKNLQKIIQPHKEAERMLSEQLQKDPEFLNSLIDLQKSSPGAVEGQYGKKVADFVTRSSYTPTRVQEDKQKEATLAQTQASTRGTELASDAQEARNVRLQQIAEFASNAPPDALEAINYKELLGVTKDEWEEATFQGSEIRRRRELVAQAPQEPRELLDTIWNGGNVNLDLLQGTYENNPQAFQVLLGLYGDRRSDDLRRHLAALQDRVENKAFRNIILSAAVNEARESNYSGVNPAAIVADWGIDPASIGLGAASESDVAKYQQQRQANQDRVVRTNVRNELKQVNQIFTTIAGGKYTDNTERNILYGQIASGLRSAAEALGLDPNEMPRYVDVNKGFDKWVVMRDGKEVKIDQREVGELIMRLTAKAFETGPLPSAPRSRTPNTEGESIFERTQRP